MVQGRSILHWLRMPIMFHIALPATTSTIAPLRSLTCVRCSCAVAVKYERSIVLSLSRSYQPEFQCHNQSRRKLIGYWETKDDCARFFCLLPSQIPKITPRSARYAPGLRTTGGLALTMIVASAPLYCFPPNPKSSISTVI